MRERPIDAFIFRKLHSAKLSLAPEADRKTFIRRAYFDLHGLPPTVEKTEAFVRTNRRMLTRSLSMNSLPLPGTEKSGAATGSTWSATATHPGSNKIPYLLYAWRYRDYVIESFNQDKPYDRFVKEQIAGDEIYLTIRSRKAEPATTRSVRIATCCIRSRT